MSEIPFQNLVPDWIIQKVLSFDQLENKKQTRNAGLGSFPKGKSKNNKMRHWDDQFFSFAGISTDGSQQEADETNLRVRKEIEGDRWQQSLKSPLRTNFDKSKDFTFKKATGFIREPILKCSLLGGLNGGRVYCRAFKACLLSPYGTRLQNV